MLRILSVAIILLLPNLSVATTFELADENTRVVGHNLIVYSHKEDTLLDIGRRFDLGYSEIVNANPNLDPWLPGEGQKVLVPNRFILPDAPKRGIVINLAEMRLYYFPKVQKGELQKVITHPIGVGREGWTTPLGKANITQKIKDPSWTPPASIHAEHIAKGDPLPKVVPAGPDNPLGAYAMRLSMPGYLLHGTNRPFGVGLRVSHGCIRLFPEDIEHLFGIVPVNTPVNILYQPYKAAIFKNDLFLEAHEVQYDIDSRKGSNMTPMVSAILGAQNSILADDDWPFVEKIVREHMGVVKQINQSDSDIVDDIWFIHAGINRDSKTKLVQALMSLSSDDYFWPLQGSAVDEVVLGPFDSHTKAETKARELRAVANIEVWTALISKEAL
ncbi:MAG: L,D-transpeptidase family protein [Gammaproteobacteria bacterium]|nr:L,D-transpeptidase family protein [Gammaproteobacteria bacterium]